MDFYEATNMVFTKIKYLDPENASKIMGYLLIQDHGEKDLIRLAFGPEAYLHALILKARTHLGLSSNTSFTPSSPSPLNPIARPTNANNPFSHSSPRLPNGFDFPKNPSSPSSNCWPLSGFSNNSISPKSSPLLSYDNIRAGSLSLPPLRNGFESNTGATNNADLLDEYQLNEYLSFLNDSSSSPSRAEDFLELGHGGQNWTHSGNNGDAHFHRRSYSASDVCFGSEEPGLGSGYKPCLYFARGFCKNGSNCKFVHGGFSDSMDGGPGPIVGSPTKFDEFELHEEIMRLKAAQHQRQFMPGLSVSPSPSPSSSSSSYNKYIAFLLQQQQQQNDPQRAAAAAAFMMGEEFYKFGRCRPERNDFFAMASEKANSASRQIYLTFPADSTFKDEDVSEYFGNFGQVQDVRIPYQQKRMFGFVTFVYPDTVKHILAKGNPHFICDSRVLVKPYKEKGKVSDRRQQQQLDRGEFSPCLSPSGLETREPYDLHLGARMFYNTQEMLFRRKLEEQAELQQAIELQGRRLMNLQLPDLNDRIPHHQRSLSVGAPISLTPQPHTHINQNGILSSDSIKQEVAEGHTDNRAAPISTAAAAEHQQEGNSGAMHNNGSGNSKEESFNPEEFDLHKSVEQVLPDSLLPSPTKSAVDNLSDSSAMAEVNESSAFSELSLPTTSASDKALQ